MSSYSTSAGHAPGAALVSLVIIIVIVIAVIVVVVVVVIVVIVVVIAVVVVIVASGVRGFVFGLFFRATSSASSSATSSTFFGGPRNPLELPSSSYSSYSSSSSTTLQLSQRARSEVLLHLGQFGIGDPARVHHFHFANANALQRKIGDQRDDQLNGTNGVVVAGDHVIDWVRIGLCRPCPRWECSLLASLTAKSSRCVSTTKKQVGQARHGLEAADAPVEFLDPRGWRAALS